MYGYPYAYAYTLTDPHPGTAGERLTTKRVIALIQIALVTVATLLWAAAEARAAEADAGPEVSNWVTAGNAMNTLAGKGVAVVAPAGGDHGWGSWGPQLGAMSGDLTAAIAA
jgi:hypothetical protein